MPHPAAATGAWCGTLVASSYDWSLVSAAEHERPPYPRIPESALRATLGILARTVER
jgi:hypothetical protein